MGCCPACSLLFPSLRGKWVLGKFMSCDARNLCAWPCLGMSSLYLPLPTAHQLGVRKDTNRTAPPSGRPSQCQQLQQLWNVGHISPQKDPHGNQWLHKHLERASGALWNFSFFLGKLGERDSEAGFALQPEGGLFSLALD